jgi:hypothetical protein
MAISKPMPTSIKKPEMIERLLSIILTTGDLKKYAADRSAGGTLEQNNSFNRNQDSTSLSMVPAFL